MSRIAIIDGDVLAYQACKPRWQSKAKIENGVSFVSLDEHGKKVPLEFTVEEDRKYLEESWVNFEKILNKMFETLFCTDYLMAVKSGPSYRDLMYPIELNEDKTKAIWGYKANRWKPEGEQNKFVKTLRELAVFEGMAIPAVGREADDYIRIWANEARESGDDYVICSIDKDLQCIPGMHYLMHKEELIEVTPQAATRHYYEQLLKGDLTDNVPGVPRIGDVKASKILAQYNTEEEFQECVVSHYIEAYGDNWFDYFLSNAKMIHIQRDMNDFFRPAEWPILRELCNLK